jgi:UDP-3-O-[3-hydroxymyristoyl] N-acetylglucosamine deacetylase
MRRSFRRRCPHRLHPAEANHGIVFLRTGLPNGRDRLIDARHIAVSATELCTVIGERESGAVATIEHLMSALYGLGVDNVLVEIDGVEVPILDGSAAPFIDAIDQVGITTCNAARRYLKVLKPVRASQGKSFAELTPDDRGFRLDVEIDFGNSAIGRQRKIFALTGTGYRREIARARTFRLHA